MRLVVLGGTSGIGRALTRLCAQRGDRLFLLGQSLASLDRSARDLEVRGATGDVGTAHCDLLRPATFGPALDAAIAGLGHVDGVVVTAALFATQAELEEDRALAARVLTANFTNTVLLCEEVRDRLLAQGGGTLCVFSSVAGDRGRKPVVLYGAAKAGLSRYLEGLDHRFRDRGIRTVCVKPGFVRTSMTAGLKPPPFAGEPSRVARRVLRAIELGTPEVYAPAVWRPLMYIIRQLPRSIMRRLQF